MRELVGRLPKRLRLFAIANLCLTILFFVAGVLAPLWGENVYISVGALVWVWPSMALVAGDRSVGVLMRVVLASSAALFLVVAASVVLTKRPDALAWGPYEFDDQSSVLSVLFASFAVSVWGAAAIHRFLRDFAAQ